MHRYGIELSVCPNCKGEVAVLVFDEEGNKDAYICGWCTGGFMDVRQHDKYAEYLNSL